MRKQLKSVRKETARLQIPKHADPLDSGIIPDNARDWIFPSSHGMRGKRKISAAYQGLLPGGRFR